MKKIRFETKNTETYLIYCLAVNLFGVIKLNWLFSMLKKKKNIYKSNQNVPNVSNTKHLLDLICSIILVSSPSINRSNILINCWPSKRCNMLLLLLLDCFNNSCIIILLIGWLYVVNVDDNGDDDDNDGDEEDDDDDDDNVGVPFVESSFKKKGERKKGKFFSK